MHPAPTPTAHSPRGGGPGRAALLVAKMRPACALFAPSRAGASMPKLTTVCRPEP
jgi:hypothetical protein